MKIKNCFKYLLFSIGMLAFTNITFAANSVPVTGTAYSEKIGLVHFDYKTACLEDINDADGDSNLSECLDKSDAAYNNPNYYLGPTKQFFIDPYAPYYFTQGPGNTTNYVPGSSNVTVQISTLDTECFSNTGDYREGCLLKGFAWSDKIGWISFDGKNVLAPSIAAEGGTFAEKWYPRIKMDHPSNPNRAPLTGFAWNEYTGWIMLSSDDSGAQGVVTDVNGQTAGNWGVWLDYTMQTKRMITNPGPPEESDKLGRNLQGYAWSEKLGWIKFSKSATDDINFETLTLWTPDQTPPIPLAPDQLWFAPGVNTGYPSITVVPQNIVWNEFAIDPESGVNEKMSKIYLVNDGTVGCETPVLTGTPAYQKSIRGMTYNMPSSPYDYDSLGVGDIMRLILPSMAILQNVPRGYCKYVLEAEIWNDVNDVIYIGNHFQPTPVQPVDGEHYFNSVTIYVRAGDFSTAISKVTVDPTTPKTFADGKQPVKYTVDFKDVAGNPIMDIAHGAAYTDSPGREVAVTANISNELLYDLTQPLSTQKIRPVIYGDANIGGSAKAFAECDTPGSPIIACDTSGISFNEGDLSWPVQVYNGNDEWDIELNRVDSPLSYPITLASFAPSGTFYRSDLGTTFPVGFEVNSFNYKIFNEKLPQISKELEVVTPLPFPPNFKATNTSLEIKACYDDNDPATPVTPAAISCANPNFPTTIPGPRASVAGVAQTGIIETDVAKTVAFDPALSTGNAKLSGELGETNTLTMSYPADLSFDITNDSSSNLLSTDKSGVSIDNIIQYYGNASAASMESHRISNETAGETDSYLGWTDPFEFCANCTRYEMYMKDGYNYGDPSMELLGSSNTPFTLFFEQFHSGSKFYYNDDALDDSKDVFSNDLSGAPDEIRNQILSDNPDYLDTDKQIGSDGRYYLTGHASIPKLYDPILSKDAGGDLNNPFNYDPGYIDRCDASVLDLTSGAKLTKQIRFFPEKLITVPLSGLKLRFIQEIAYRFNQNNQILYAKYAVENPLLNDIEVKDVGLEATGTVIGKQIVTGRKFDVVGSAASRKLQEQIRRNVAEMLAGVDTKCPIPSNPLLSFDAADDDGDCVTKDAVNGTMFAYYDGEPGQILTLGNGTDDLIAPDLPYTIIVKGGPDVFIKSNIKYDPAKPKTSFGIILIAQDIGNGANVYISPDPTNISAVVYAEGSVLSKSNSGTLPEEFLYYGGGTADIKELKNQLYWRGSIASRNTIAGAGQKTIPSGVSCLENDTDFTCAQRFDMDYLRRFTVVIDQSNGNFTKIANNGKYSGGGTCDATLGTCTPGPADLPTKINLDGNGHILETASELATVFVEKDPATVNNPPPGFTITFGLESIQEIR